MSAFCLLFTVDLLYTTISLCLDLFHWAKFRQAKVLAIAVWGTPRLVQSLWGLGVLAVWLHADAGPSLVGLRPARRGVRA